MQTQIDESQVALAEQFVAEADQHDGLIPLDLDRFWEDDAKAHQDPWADDCPQVPIGLHGSMGECVFTELGIAEDWYRWNHDRAWRAELNKAYNDKSERIVGKRLLGEGVPDPNRPHFPAVKGLHDIFEAKNVWHHESYWLMQSADNEDELKALLDRVDERLSDLRSFLLPPEWDEVKPGLVEQGVKPPGYRGQRGPCTFATSIYGPENLLFLLMDNVNLAERFRDTILRAMLGRAAVLDAEGGWTPDADWGHGFAFMDDNCCLLSPDMYEMFGYPILKGLFEKYAPKPEHSRYQHSDSAMGHLLPILARLNLKACNFGPTLTVDEIRQHMPNTCIHGQLAPFTFSRDERVNVIAEFLRDYEQARETKGLVFATAGSINNGSRLKTLRLVMAAAQRLGRY
jgi:uroporphyrinogen decarboxylase